MDKPCWSDAPSWAMYLAQNDDGKWWWYEKKPSLSRRMGFHFSESGGEYKEATYKLDWENSLEDRP
jgi:hypothetical protein